MIHKIILFSLMMFLSFSVFAERTIKGFVYDKNDNSGLVSAIVQVKDTEIGITTDYEGFFELEIPDGKTTLVISYTGYKTKKLVIEKGETEILKIYLEVDQILSEVVVVASKSRDEREKDRKYKEETLSGKTSGVVVADSKLEVGSVATEVTSPATYSTSTITPEKKKGKRKKNKKDKVLAEEPMPVVVESSPSMDVPADDAYEDVMIDMSDVEEVAVSVDEEPIVIRGAGAIANLPAAGQLTAGILNDYGKWNLWQDIQENELKEWQATWSIRPWDRYPVQLTTQNGYPIINAKVHLKEAGLVIWSARTDNTGRAELWSNLYEEKESGNYTIDVEYEGNIYPIESAQSFHEGGNAKVIPVQCNINKKIDIAFVVDATGSMGDEIDYLKSELTDVINRSKEALEDTELRLGSVFYRDLGDAYVTRKSHFSTDIGKIANFIKEQGAAGGGDGPEAIEEALDEALDNLAWSNDASARLLFLVLDAPPHESKEIKDRLRIHIERAAKMGIRIIPVACSGTGRSTEYLMRSFALATNGSYIYLTDDSGIGGSHQKPITDEHKVNLLNDLLVQTITDFSSTASCDEQLDFVDEEVQDTMMVALVDNQQINLDQGDIIKKTEFSWKYYPNPSRGQLTVEIEGELDFLYLLDGAGKLLRRITITNSKFELDIRDYPSGIYFLRGIGKDERDVSGKVILVRPN